MSLKRLSNLIIYIVFIFPFFYDYLDILPYPFKWVLDLIILITLVLLSTRVKVPKNKVYKLYRTYTVLTILAITFSAVYNNSSIIFSLAALRRAILPFALFYIFYHSIYIYKKDIYKKTYNRVVYLQLFIVPVEYLSYLFYHGFTSFLATTVPINSFDIASGTIGAGGTGVLGVLLVLYFVYSRVYLKKGVSYIFLIPLLFLFSGGAYLLALLAIFLVMTFFKYKNIKQRVKTWLYIIVVAVLGFYISNVVFEGRLFEKVFSGIEQYYTFNFVNQGETFGNSDQKLSRVNGFKYVDEYLDSFGKKVFGLGPSSVAKSRTFGVSSYELGTITGIKSESLYRYILSGMLGLIVAYFFYLYLLLYFVKRYKQNKYYLAGTMIMILFLISTFYIQTINDPTIMAFLGSFLALSVLQGRKKVST